MLFRDNGQYKTMEEILKTPPISSIQHVSGVCAYSFESKGPNQETIDLYKKILLQIPNGHLLNSLMNSGKSEGGEAICICRLRVTTDISSILRARGIEYEVDYFPVSVTSRRRVI